MKNPQIHTREALLMDQQTLLQLESECFNEDGFSAELIAELLQDEEVNIWLSYCGKDVVGALYVIWKQEFARLFSIAVTPQARGKGIGRTMLAKAEMEARSRGYKEIRLELKPKNSVALHLYEKVGFHEMPHSPGLDADGNEAIFMNKHLS